MLDLLAAMHDRPCTALLDERMVIPDDLSKKIKLLRYRPSVFGRLKAETNLRQMARPEDVVLCLGNLPPLFRLEARRTVLFVQNRYLLGSISTSGFPLAARLRIAVERRWLQGCASHAQSIMVQSHSMAEAVRQFLHTSSVIAPFSTPRSRAEARSSRVAAADPAETVFLYVASGEPHKNHRRLVQAWRLLAAEGLRPELQLTLDPLRHPRLTEWIESERQHHGLRIHNAGLVDTEALDCLYRGADALIFPSTAESLGLPLLEACAFGLPIIASERDFVRDVTRPQETFDPESALSIARAVRRFLAIKEDPVHVRTADEFLDLVCDS